MQGQQVNPQSELETAVKDNNHTQEEIVNRKAIVKRLPIYITIFNVLYDGKFHTKDEFCRPYSADIRRLEEMQNPKGWINFESRKVMKDGKVYYTEYRITKIWDCFWDYYKQYSVTRPTVSGQQEFAGVR